MITLTSRFSSVMLHVIMLRTMALHYKSFLESQKPYARRSFLGANRRSSTSHVIYRARKNANGLHSCLAHVINLATQVLISAYSRAPHYNPHDPKGHEVDTSQMANRDEIGLVRTICVKVSPSSFTISYTTLHLPDQERSSAKRKELYQTIQTKAGVSQPTQLLIDMKVRWSSTYIMINRAERNRDVRISHIHDHF
jgi:hypothetical protein